MVLERLSEAAATTTRPCDRRWIGDQPRRRIQRTDRTHGPSQQRVINQALANAGLTHDQVDAVEATAPAPHWVTPSKPRPTRHLRPPPHARSTALAGIHQIQHRPHPSRRRAAGVVKMIQAITHATLPATLHVDQPAPHRLVQRHSPTPNRAHPMANTDHPRTAAVSSFASAAP
ncbi:beta-ketoacyl synthase, C-terminal domain protein, partial [Mycobacterium ulcerans str. Harvey]